MGSGLGVVGISASSATRRRRCILDQPSPPFLARRSGSCMIIVFVIVAGMVVVIKILLEFPGLLQWKCVYSEHEHEEVTGPAYLRRDLELGRARRSPRASKHSLHRSNSRVMETEMVEMGSKSSQVHWSRESEHNLQHHHNESNRIDHHEKSRHHDRSNQHERNGRPGLKSSK